MNRLRRLSSAEPAFLAGKKIAVLLNSASGQRLESPAERDKRVRWVFDFIQADVSVELVAPSRLSERLDELKSGGIDILFVGGGDGSLSTAAAALAGTNIVLGVLPLGTFNNFAKDLGVPVGLERAIYALASGTPRAVDVGEVNGRVFVNNASIGIYPFAVQRRMLYQQQLGLRKLPAMGYALLGVFWHMPIAKVWLEIDGQREYVKTPFVFVGNNIYDIDPYAAVWRKVLDGNCLSVFYTRRLHRYNLLWIAAKILFGRQRHPPELAQLQARTIVVDPGKRSLKLALDGEVLEMQAPLRFRVRRRALWVLVPP